jgi:hypothetical protein
MSRESNEYVMQCIKKMVDKEGLNSEKNNARIKHLFKVCEEYKSALGVRYWVEMNWLVRLPAIQLDFKDHHVLHTFSEGEINYLMKVENQSFEERIKSKLINIDKAMIIHIHNGRKFPSLKEQK